MFKRAARQTLGLGEYNRARKKEHANKMLNQIVENEGSNYMYRGRILYDNLQSAVDDFKNMLPAEDKAKWEKDEEKPQHPGTKLQAILDNAKKGQNAPTNSFFSLGYSDANEETTGGKRKSRRVKKSKRKRTKKSKTKKRRSTRRK